MRASEKATESNVLNTINDSSKEREELETSNHFVSLTVDIPSTNYSDEPHSSNVTPFISTPHTPGSIRNNSTSTSTTYSPIVIDSPIVMHSPRVMRSPESTEHNWLNWAFLNLQLTSKNSLLILLAATGAALTIGGLIAGSAVVTTVGVVIGTGALLAHYGFCGSQKTTPVLVDPANELEMGMRQ